MLEMGLMDEIEKLMKMGFENFLTSPQAIGYKEFIPCMKGEKPLQECLTEMVKNTKEYAKRQIRWFRKQGWNEVDIEKLGIEGAVEEIRIKLLDLRPTQNH